MTAGLGSCIGVCIYDLQSQVAGMAHIMLPSSKDSMKGNPAKYADSCLELMLGELYKLGVSGSD
jgi:chemotaxis protein CheD